MVTRRHALKVGAASVASAGILGGSRGLPAPISAQTPMASPVATPIAWTHAALGSQFLGNAGRTGEMPGPGPNTSDALVLRWQAEASSGRLWKLPILAGDLLFSATYSDLTARNALTATPQWTYSTGSDTIRALAADAERVYLGVSANSSSSTPSAGDGGLRALLAATGEELWRFGGAMDEVLVINDVVFGWESDSGYAVSATTGEELWRATIPNTTWMTADDDFLYSWGYANGVQAYSLKNGEEVWRSGVSVPSSMSPTGSGFIWARDQRVYAQIIADMDGSNVGILRVYGAETGEEIWRADSLYASAFIAVNDALVFLPVRDGTLRALDAADGSERWRYRGRIEITGAPVIVGDSVWFGEANGNLVIADAQTGEVRWQLNVFDAVSSMPLSGLMDSLGVDYWNRRPVDWPISPIIADGLAIFSWNDRMFCISNRPESHVLEDTPLRGAPSPSGVERTVLHADDTLIPTGNRDQVNGAIWIEVMAGELTGWIPESALDPATLPPEGDMITITQP